MKVFKIIALCSLSLLCASCSLKERILSESTMDSYYKTPQECLTGLNACYTNVRAILNNSKYFTTSECQSDLMVLRAVDQKEATLQITPAQPQFGATLWQQAYNGIMRANSVEAAILRADFSEEEKRPLLAEAVVLRSLFYYLLTINFGDVPFYEEEVTWKNNDSIARLPRMSASKTRTTLIEELDYHLLQCKSLDFKRTNDEDNQQRYRIGAAVGLMLAGKMCLWEERWSDAIKYFGVLEDIYGPGAGKPEGALAQYPLSDLPFGRRYIDESILEIANTSTEYGLIVTGALASICTPVRQVSTSEGADSSVEDDDSGMDEEEDENSDLSADSDIYQGIRIPELGPYARTRTPARPTYRFFKYLMPYTSTDRRMARYDVLGNKIEDSGGYMAWGWEGYDPSEDMSVAQPAFRMFNGLKSYSRPYLGNKFWCFGMRYTKDSNSYRFFRYAGVLLSLAECWTMKGDKAKACAYLNEVRRRAGLEALNPGDFTVDALMAMVRDESGRELFGECQRKADLVRWGVWYDYVLKYNAGPVNSADNYMESGENNTIMMRNLKPCHRYFPIPDEQITYSGGALDNNEYNSCGL